jgi:hypothetical protein
MKDERTTGEQFMRLLDPTGDRSDDWRIVIDGSVHSELECSHARPVSDAPGYFQLPYAVEVIGDDRYSGSVICLECLVEAACHFGIRTRE